MREHATYPASPIDSARRVLTGPTGTGILASLALVVVAGIVAPGDGPGIWTWLRVLAIWLLVALSLGTIVEVGTGRHRANGTSPLVVWGALGLAILIGFSFDTLALALTVLSVVILLLAAPSAGHALTFWIAVATLTPLWVWSAFEAWDRWLLMLLPVAAVGLVSLEHAVRAGHAGGNPRETMAAWIGLLGLAAITVLVALLGPVDPSWSTAAALAVAALATIDIGLSRLPRVPLSPVILPAAALALVTLGWMVAL
jgi:hypothetical protein